MKKNKNDKFVENENPFVVIKKPETKKKEKESPFQKAAKDKK